MTGKDLKPLDIVVLREGTVGVCVESAGELCILYQDCGYDEVDFEFDDELKHESGGPDFDIMRVYREPHGEILPLVGYEEDGELIYERDRSWKLPTPEEREEMRLERERLHEEEVKKRAEESKKAIHTEKWLFILAQAFYGNRTVTKITEDRIDSFILGYVSAEAIEREMKPEDIDRTIVRIPGTENLVLIYNRYRDEKCKKRGIRMTARIPEINLVLNSRCIVLRMNDDGSFASIEDEDFEKVMKYLAE